MLTRYAYYGPILVFSTLVLALYIGFICLPIASWRGPHTWRNDTLSTETAYHNHSTHLVKHVLVKLNSTGTTGRLPQPPSTGMTGGRESAWPVNFWSSRDGRFLPGKHTIISQNRIYALTLSRAGEILIHRHRGDERPVPIFWSNTALQWVGEKWAEISAEGHFMSRHKEKPRSGNVTVWTTGQWRECKRKVPKGFVALVMLTDVGALRMIHVRSALVDEYNSRGLLDEQGWDENEERSYTVCEPYSGDPEKLRAEGKEDMGRLAVVLTGAMRSYRDTCTPMNEKVFDKWPGSKGVDIFVVTVDYDAWGRGNENGGIHWSSVEKDLFKCFGDRFKGLKVVEPLAKFPDFEHTGRCKSGRTPMDHLINIELYVERARIMVMNHMIRQAISYDYILRMRPDHYVWGDAIPPFEPLELDTIVYPMPYWEGLTWATTHLGASVLTPSDQAAFGRFLPMSTYMSLFSSFPDLVKTSQVDPPKAQLKSLHRSRKDVPPFFSAPCFEPKSPCPYDTSWPCLIEGYMSYWPTLHGLRIKLDWRWKMNLLRHNGHLAKGWGGAWNKSQGTRLVDTAFD